MEVPDILVTDERQVLDEVFGGFRFSRTRLSANGNALRVPGRAHCTVRLVSDMVNVWISILSAWQIDITQVPLQSKELQVNKRVAQTAFIFKPSHDSAVANRINISLMVTATSNGKLEY